MKLKLKLLLLLLLIVTTGFGFYLYQRYSLEKRHAFVPEKKHRNDTLRIGIIGDSWATGITIDTIIRDEFIKRGINTEVIAFGQPEAKTKEIYDNLYANPGQPYSSYEILHHNLDYCIILAGTSDAEGEMGAKFYAYYCSLIISDLARNNIEPVFVTMPEFGFKEETDSLDILKKVRNEVSSLLIDNGNTRSLDGYRKQASEMLKNTHLKDSSIIVPFNLVCDDYEKHKILYRNTGHLSTVGKQKMGKVIVEYILEKEKAANAKKKQLNTNIVATEQLKKVKRA